MKAENSFNPLNKQNLGVSVADALLTKDVGPLPPAVSFIGAGIYAIYYVGDYPPYKPIAERNRDGKYQAPIYVGKAVPAGARKGGFGLGLNPGTVLYSRLTNDHAESIRQVTNLNLADFSCRYLVVDDIWIPLAESLLIETYQPAWNRLIDGFGNHDPGKNRYGGAKTKWDVLHPGRDWAKKMIGVSSPELEILKELELFLAGRLVPPPQLPALDEDPPVS